MMRKRIILAVIFLFGVGFFFYVLWDNNRIKVVEKDIEVETDDGITILQISDLHEKEFGKNQNKLIEKINNVDYDVLLFTGDMLDSIDSTNTGSFYTLIEGIHNKEHAFYVPGNTDPYSYDVTEHHVEKSDFVKGMEARGVQLLETVEMIRVKKTNYYFVYFDAATIGNVYKAKDMIYAPYALEPIYQAYLQKRLEDFTALEAASEQDVLIGVTHFPVVDNRIDYIQNDENYVWRNFDLIIAGHYHGGQIRLPFIGALFVPEPWYERNGFFPPQNRVKGLWEYRGTKQYVSAGLGSSNAVPFLAFRLFNPPEINMITLK